MRNNNNWGKYDIPEEIEPTKTEKVWQIIEGIIGSILIMAVMYILVCLVGAF